MKIMPLMNMSAVDEVTGHLQPLHIRECNEICAFEQGVGTVAARRQAHLQWRRQEDEGHRHSSLAP